MHILVLNYNEITKIRTKGFAKFSKKIIKKFAKFLSKSDCIYGKEQILSAVDFYLGNKQECIK